MSWFLPGLASTTPSLHRWGNWAPSSPPSLSSWAPGPPPLGMWGCLALPYVCDRGYLTEGDATALPLLLPPTICGPRWGPHHFRERWILSSARCISQDSYSPGMALKQAQAMERTQAPGEAKPRLGKGTQTFNPESIILGSAPAQLRDSASPHVWPTLGSVVFHSFLHFTFTFSLD